MRVLVVNAGSSSVKLRLLDGTEVLATADLALHDGRVHADQVLDAIDGWPAPDVVGHRVVHGGSRYTTATELTDHVVADLHDLTDLAPLHQPKSLRALAAVSEVLPDVTAYACFDTGFHSTLPPAAYTYAVPRAWRERWRIRRYGFHGLSHAYIARRAAELGAGPRVISAHLGSGASLCAIVDGQSVDTTMGFTPLEGLVMGTRSGDVDPGLVLWLEEHEQIPPSAVAHALEHESGLKGLAGVADLREVERRLAAGDADASLAIDVYVHRLAAELAAMAASAGGVDAVLFTGGVGENSPLVRRRAAAAMRWLGLGIDEAANCDETRPDRDVTAADASVRAFVVAAREDLQIAAEIQAVAG